MTAWFPALALLACVPLAACGGSTPAPSPPATTADGTTMTPPPPGEPIPPAGADRPVLTSEECAARGGSVVGDIGDGATHRPDYLCASGAAPLGNVQLGIEGSVCCPGGPAQGTSAPAP